MNSRRRGTRTALSRINRRSQRRMRGTVVRIHNKRPIPPQRDPLPLNLGSGGMSNTFRVVRPVTFSLVVSSINDVTLSRLHVIGSQDEISGTDIFEGYINLARHFEEYKINSARTTLTTFAGFDSKSQVAMALVPYSYDDWTPAPGGVNTFYKVLNQGVFVLKHAQKENAASWLPTQAKDYDYSDLDGSGKNDNSQFKLMMAGCLVPNDFPIVSVATLAPSKDVTVTYFLGHVTLDVNMILRGRNTNDNHVFSAQQESVYGRPLQMTHIGAMRGTLNDDEIGKFHSLISEN